MPDPAVAQQIAEYASHLADDLKPWAPVGVPIILFGRRQAVALAKRFYDHFKHDAPETQEQAVRNGSDAAQRMRDDVNSRVERGELSEEQARAAFERPDIAKHAQDALLAASETPDPLLHEELAKLIGARLVAPRESRVSIFLRMAADQLHYLNARQLRILGLTFAMLYLEPAIPDLSGADQATVDEAFGRYLLDLDDTLAPFHDLPPLRLIDFSHFAELGLADVLKSATSGMYTSADEQRSTVLMPFQRQFAAKVIGPQDATSEWARFLMDGNRMQGEFGLKGIRLTPVGYVMGQCMYSIAHGIEFNPLRDWVGE
jgi:hypothetical protein